MSDGGPAFPVTSERNANGDVIQGPDYGMSLRDYFAAKALPAVIKSYHQPWDKPQGIANEAYTYADAMLEARK